MIKKTETISNKNTKYEDAEFSKLLGDKYLAYALSTITSRSLPDVRDGLKPVHRRLLFAMRELNLEPKSGFKKCARVVGDVIGKFHPHGDQSVYDALVRLAQSFSARYPLVDGQGNFGNIDGDNPAAMRYTESRLTSIAESLMEGIDEDAIDFMETYDGSENEPVVMPGKFPNLLANGSTGIAVGMATSIPPHNVEEICNALLYLIDSPEGNIQKIFNYISGPDFPTGGILVESKKTIKEIYSQGKGSMRVRAKWSVEKNGSKKWNIVIHELPFQVQKSRLIERLADLILQKKLPILENIRDESTEEVRIVIMPKSYDLDPSEFMELLFKNSELETKFNLNMNVLENGKIPKLMNLKSVLDSFLKHRLEVFTRILKYRLNKIENKMEILSGYLVVYLNLDKLIKIIRGNDSPKPILISNFKLSDVQVEAILNMKLRALRKLEEKQIKKEYDDLKKQKSEIKSLLKYKQKRWEKIKEEINEIKIKFGKKTDIGVRKTIIGNEPKVKLKEIEQYIEKEPITILCSKKGWIRTIKGHSNPDNNEKHKDGDGPRFWIKSYTTDKLVLFGNNGRFYNINVDKLPSGRGFGDPVRSFIDLPAESDLVTIFTFYKGGRILICSSDGKGFLINGVDTISQTKSGRQVMNLKKGNYAKVCTPVNGDKIATIGENRKLLIFSIDELPTMTKGRGVTLQKYRDGELSDAICFFQKNGLYWHSGNKIRVEHDFKQWVGKRANAGKFAPKGFPRNNRFTL
ncbi:MAG: DNA topoisomerase IV subunit A [Rhodospirillaceae bacterium]|nr:DNA topoisomerase IV subunit A [Rhodospirillaceae bacterium]|tara:strand:- start:11411 stop:13651 length:2241 start_codon:yes stop_codon:yes gene_type:complete